jgi:hypothetical protein
MLRESSVAKPKDHQLLLSPLRRTVEALYQRIETPGTPRPSLDAEFVWKQFMDVDFVLEQLSKREQTALCIDPRTAVRSQLVQALKRNPGALNRMSTLYGFVNAYFEKWRTFEEPEVIEALIWNIIEVRHKTRRSRILQAWAKNPYLFTSSAAEDRNCSL